MSIIKELAKVVVQNIKNKQNFFTFRSRKKALQEFELFLNNDNLTDDEIIYTAMQKSTWVSEHGFFGIRGRAGSTFLNEMDQFTQLSLYLMNNKDDHTRSIIKKMADFLLEDFQKTRNQITDPGQKAAANNLVLAFSRADVTDNDLIAAAQAQKTYAETNGKFGFWGRAGSSFLNKITNFLEQTTQLRTLGLTKEPEERINIFAPSIFCELQKKAREFGHKKRYAPSDYDLKDKKHAILEEGIKRLLAEHFGYMSRIARAWRFRMDKTVTGESEIDNLLFFSQFDKELNEKAKLPNELREKINSYLILVEDEEFVIQKKNSFSANEKESQKEIFHLLHQKSLNEEMKELPTIKKPFLHDTETSLCKYSEEYKIGQEIVREENENSLIKIGRP